MQKSIPKRKEELESLVETELDKLFRFAYMRVGNRADAEDIVQDVFLKLFASTDGKPTHIQNLQHYLIRAVSNGCHDYLRKKPASLFPLDEAARLPADEEEREMHEEYLRINRMLAYIPAEQTEILRLRCVDELKFKDIALLLGIPESTAKSRYRYAIDHLQKQLTLQS